jgi:hypothetical protein
MLKYSMTVACALLAVALVPAVASAQTAPPAFGGERLSENDPTITTCAIGGSGGYLTYEASGTATGPYPGTFTETGRITVGPEEAPTLRQRITTVSIDFAIDTVSIDFAIDSSVGQVTGTKTFAATGDPNAGVANTKCLNDWDGTSGSAFAAADDLRYSVTIQTPDGQTCTQSGGTSLSLVDNSPVLADSLTETFLNDLSAPAPVCTGGEPEPEAEPELPVSKDDCLAGGYARYGFKNQGECIAWVNHNLP